MLSLMMNAGVMMTNLKAELPSYGMLKPESDQDRQIDSRTEI